MIIIQFCYCCRFIRQMGDSMEKPTICIGENKDTDQLRSNCEANQRICFRCTRIVQFLYFLIPKFPVSNNLLCLYSPVCVGPGQNPNCWFSHAQAQTVFLQQVLYRKDSLIFLNHETGKILNVNIGPSDERTNARQLFIVSIISILNQCAHGDKKIFNLLIRLNLFYLCILKIFVL